MILNCYMVNYSSSILLLSTRRVAIALIFIAGYVDVVGYLTLSGVFVSFMSGNSTSTGLHLGQAQGEAFAKAVLPVIVFVLSIGVGSWMVRRRHGLRMVLLLQVALLTAFAVISNSVMPNTHPRGDEWIVLTLTSVFAMGLQNVVVRHIGQDSVGLTYLTGMLAALGMHLAGWLDRSEPQAGTHIGLLATLWFSFVAGATFSSWLAIELGVTLLPPLIMLLILLLLDFRSPLLASVQQQ
jgi:uncharacterized membrane protein YoaK (UPF0700 family)